MEDQKLQEMLTSYETETDIRKRLGKVINLAMYYRDNLLEKAIAKMYLHQALSLAEGLQNDFILARVCHELAIIYIYQEDFKTVKDLIHRGISLAEPLQNKYADILLSHLFVNLGYVHIEYESNIQRGLDFYIRAMSVAQKHGEKGLLGGIYEQIAEANYYLGDFQKSLYYSRQALKLLPLEHYALKRVGLFVFTGRLYYLLKDYTLAVGYWKRSIRLSEGFDVSRRYFFGVFCELSDAYVDSKKYDKALFWLQKAKEYIENTKDDTKDLINRLYISYIFIYTEKGDFSEAEYYVQKFLELTVSDDNMLRDFYSRVYLLFEKQQKYDVAFEYIKKYYIIKEKILDDEKKKNMAVQTANFEYEREKQKAEFLKQKHDELEIQYNIIDQKNVELVQLHEEKDHLMNTISHDLKNYLGATQQALEIFNLKEKAMADNKYLKIANTSTMRSLNLVKEILYSTKVSATKDTLSLQVVDMNQVVCENEDTLHLRGNKKGIDIVFKYSNEPLPVELDNEKWHRVFENLTTNAIKFTPTGQKIYISTKREDAFACISIKDCGIGIAPENISKLFTPFSGVGRQGTEGEESTGLGLSIVKKLVELHGGKIEVSSEVGKGTEFVVRLRCVS